MGEGCFEEDFGGEFDGGIDFRHARVKELVVVLEGLAFFVVSFYLIGIGPFGLDGGIALGLGFCFADADAFFHGLLGGGGGGVAFFQGIGGEIGPIFFGRIGECGNEGEIDWGRKNLCWPRGDEFEAIGIGGVLSGKREGDEEESDG